MEFHKPLPPTKMMPTPRRRKPAGQAFYLAVFAISIVAAVSLMRSPNGDFGPANGGQLAYSLLQRRDEEVSQWAGVRKILADGSVVSVRKRNSAQRTMCLHSTQLCGRRSRPALLPPTLLLLPCPCQTRRIHNPCLMDKPSLHYHRYRCFRLPMRKFEYNRKHFGHERELNRRHLFGIRKWQSGRLFDICGYELSQRQSCYWRAIWCCGLHNGCRCRKYGPGQTLPSRPEKLCS